MCNRTALNNWLTLLRLPNLLTVIGDPLVGFCVCGGVAFSGILPIMLAMVLVYIFGLVGNDLVDRVEDRRERPDRPLASGAISAPTAIAMMALCATLAMALCWNDVRMISGVGGMLILTLLYNWILKKWAVAGACGMALCRIGSCALGAWCAACNGGKFDLALIPVILALAGYIFGLSRIARDETHAKRQIVGRYILLIAASLPIASVVAIWVSNPPGWSPKLAIMLIATFLFISFFAIALKAFAYTAIPFRSPQLIQGLVGSLIAGLPVFQGGWILLSAPPNLAWLGILVTSQWFLFQFLSRRIKPS